MSNFNPDEVVSSPQPWGVWPTLSISAIILVCFFLSSAIVAGIYLGWEFQQNPALADPVEQTNFLLNFKSNGYALAWSSIVSGAIGIGLVALAIKIRSGWKLGDYLHFYWPKWNAFFIWNVLLLAMLMLEEMITRYFSKKSDFLQDILASEQSNLFWLWVTVVMMAPFFEEIFFRGFMFKGMETSWVGTMGTILVTSLVWTVIHVQYDLFFMGIIFSLGLLFGYARHVTKSLWVPISMHALNNGLAMAATTGWIHSVILT